MSGIAGIIRFDGGPVERSLIEKMTTSMAYRGPDGIHQWLQGSVAFGQCMMRTTPESFEETQPLTNEDQRLVLVMDGRVDNWQELRRALLGRGAVLRNHSDAELVLRAYDIWGRDCLWHIDGDFAFVIWDTRLKEAFCARDRMGNKPFYYHWNGTTLCFASELHPILDLPWVPLAPNKGMLAELQAAEWYSRDETLWSGVMRLIAAHRMNVGPSGPRPEQYWEPDRHATPAYTRDEEYIEHYRTLLTDSVRRLSRSHRPVAIEVSGGLDSSAVFCLAAQLRRADRLPAPEVLGYTFTSSDQSAAGEVRHARTVGEYLGLPIREVPRSAPPRSWYEERARAYREFPGYPTGLMCLGLMERAVSQGSRAVLTGQGGDAWAQGSRGYYAEELALGHWSALYDCFSTDAAVFGTRQALEWLIRQGCFPLLPMALKDALRRLARHGREDTSGSLKAYWLAPRMRTILSARRARPRPWSVLPVQRVGQRELLSALYDSLTTQVMETFEREGAHAGIEVRHPFYSQAFVQFAFSIPDRLRLRGEQAKYIHVRALQGLMPPAILDRKDKAEFSDAFHAQLDTMKDVLTGSLPQARAGWLQPEGMSRLFQAYEKTSQGGLSQWALWGVYAADKVVNID